MDDAIKALLGFDPDETVDELRANLRRDLTKLLEQYDSQAEELPEWAKHLIRALLVGNHLLSHQVAALVSGYGVGVMWPAQAIYNGLREEAAAVAGVETEAGR